MSLVEHTKAELERAGLFDKDADYGDMMGKAVLELVTVFAKQGHSGFSASQCLALFNEVANFKTLSPITSNPTEWNDVSRMSGRPMWQSNRDPSYFSHDAGKTWYTVAENSKEWV